ncbi:MAG: hypothetical protein AUH39_00465 [Chloroflexi bacterium 13_1_40CM_67_9]|nr:MAG: hypothetical protein AUH39_00465 [Chloroflexi bacterium 13_1_40CM_67_9]
MIPLRDQNPTQKTPIVNRLLVAANILVWIYVLTLVRQPGAASAFYVSEGLRTIFTIHGSKVVATELRA